MTTKKSTTKSRAASATKKKAAPAKSRAPKTTTRTRTKKTVAARSFRLEKQTTPFMTTNLTRETLYWVALGVIVILFTAWVMKLQSDIQAIYDSIDASNSAVLELPSTTNKDSSKK